MRARFLIGFTVAGLAAVLGAGAAGAGGISPGFSRDGILGPSGHVRYVAASSTRNTVVQALRVQDAHVLRSAKLRGVYGIPMVTYGGTAGGLTRDGKLLVLETSAGKPSTRFAVLATKSLKVRQTVSLPGTWAFDAFSPEGRTLYLIQILPSTDTIRYLVRAYDLGLHRLVPGAIADKSETGPMTGFPIARVASADGTWAYTLYQRGQGARPFIHALNTRARLAVCIDLDWRGSADALGQVRLTLSSDQRQLVLRRRGDGKAMLTVTAPASG